MSMSRRDYEAVAAVIASGRDFADFSTREELACRLAVVFAEDNPRFDRGRFLVACGFDS